MDSHLKKLEFARGLAQGKSGREAALGVGYSEYSAGTMSGKLKKDPTVQQELKRLMEKAGLGTVAALRELRRGLAEGKVGLHSDYLEKQLKILRIGGYGDQEKAQVQLNLFGLAARDAQIREAYGDDEQA